MYEGKKPCQRSKISAVSPPHHLVRACCHYSWTIVAFEPRCRFPYSPNPFAPQIRQISRLQCQSQAMMSRSHNEQEDRSEEHTSELQSQFHLVCRLLLEKKK